MHKSKQISSVQNTLVKKILLLKEKSRERKKTGLFIVEGQREIQLALKGGYHFDTVLFQPELIDFKETLSLFESSSSTPDYIEISKEVYQKLAYRQTTEGILAIAQSKPTLLSELKLGKKNPLILVAEAPEKPGNIGALLRTADAANLDAVLIANPKTDLYNPNIIRSSVGCVFTNHIAMGSSTEVIDFLKAQNINIYCAALSASETYTETDFKPGSAIVVGTEADGLSEEWLDSSKQNIIIPMQGEIDSMNVSVSAAILIFEAKRQRNFK
ncbi:RNA methyltransferase [Zobellia galactanivorans]|uniref:TrmH family RNA methyltransferase n=1 Tax=Zobellia galactanivorans (strain DSM 12802 / CCUG 47099 / CIP 106680 / NCIMB 13871 / Dsij) TaxID=63186 RepID=UPI0026E2B6A5|nr:RNA methyltransferase [Zobellia galactanivorans]MDO6807433.1 RNA methyltransferase [Zobellia galactanivorans]